MKAESKINESNGVRDYSDALYEAWEDGLISDDILASLIYWVSEDDIQEFMRANDLLSLVEPEDEDMEESLDEARKVGPNGTMNTVIVWATSEMKASGLPLVKWDFYNTKKPETLVKAIKSGEIQTDNIFGPHAPAKYEAMTIEEFNNIRNGLSGFDAEKALAQYMKTHGHPVEVSPFVEDDIVNKIQEYEMQNLPSWADSAEVEFAWRTDKVDGKSPEDMCDLISTSTCYNGKDGEVYCYDKNYKVFDNGKVEEISHHPSFDKHNELYKEKSEQADESLTEAKVGTKYSNGTATIKVEEPDKNGKIQFSFLDKNGRPTEIRSSNNDESFNRMLRDNGYKKVSNESLTEDTVKQGNNWVNKGKEGTHGEFKTKKAADAQRRAIWVNWKK